MKSQVLFTRLGVCRNTVAAIFLSIIAMLNNTANAQTSAAVNVAGGTNSACAVAASDAGGVSIAGTTGALRQLAAMNVTPEMPQYSLVKALSDPTPLQDLYSKLNPHFFNRKFVMRKNDAILKQIAARYIMVQRQQEFSDLVVDILTVPAAGKHGTARSHAFASRIANGLAMAGVRNVRLDHRPLNDSPLPTGQNTKTS